MAHQVKPQYAGAAINPFEGTMDKDRGVRMRPPNARYVAH